MKFNPKDLNEAHNIMFNRYLSKLDSSIQVIIHIDPKDIDYLKKMCTTMIKENEVPIDKKARWLGFIQGVLFSNGIIQISEEREFSRKLFTKFYENPVSIEI